MEKTTRRKLLLSAITAGGAAGLSTMLRPEAAAQDSHSSHNRPPDGPLASATVSFGQWNTNFSPPLDRIANVAPPASNVHLLIPNEPTIQAGGSVNFIISGLHNVQIFADGTQPSDIDRTLTVNMVNPPGLALINDPAGRIYRGPDPSTLNYVGTPPIRVVDRVEVVNFPNPGRYLVICGLLVHFFNAASQEFEMFGYVRVLP